MKKCLVFCKKIKATSAYYSLAAMNKTGFALALVFVFFVSVFTGLGTVGFAKANPDGEFPNLAMPIEYVNYTITPINGTLWAVIDGNYPITFLSQPDCSFNGDLPMVYPMPPGANDIHVYLGDQELSWVNYTAKLPWTPASYSYWRLGHDLLCPTQRIRQFPA